MTAELLLTFWLTHIAVLLVPGNNVMLVMAYGVAGSRDEATRCALGISTGTAIWCVAASNGLSLFLAAIPGAGPLMGILAASYLSYVAWGLFTIAPPSQPLKANANSAKTAYAAGLLACLSNIKAGLFFGSAFAAVLSVQADLAWELSLLAIINSLLWHLGLAFFFSTFAFLRQPAYLRGIRRLSGVALALIALLMLAQAVQALAVPAWLLNHSLKP